MQKSKPYIVVGTNQFELNCNAWELFLALKFLFENVKKINKEGYKLLCKKLIECGAFENNGI